MMNIRTLIVVADGMADEPVGALSGQTPLQAAHTPNMDVLARRGIVGLLQSIPPGMPPGSDIANMSLMGYDPATYYTGRAPLEAASMGVLLEQEDVAFRCNLVTLGDGPDGGVMADYSGGGIASQQARELIRLLNERLQGPDRTFHAGVSYRHLLVWKGAADRFFGVQTTPPHDISARPIASYLPRGKGSELLNRLMEEARGVLAGLDCAQAVSSPSREGPNAIWLWGQGVACRLPPLRERRGVRGAVVCAVDLIKGLGRCAGMSVIPVPGATGDVDTNFQGKAVATLGALRDHDLVFLHVESADEASHRGDVEQKIRSIERIDREVIGVLCHGLRRKGIPHRLLILPDHATPVRTRTHSDQPIPFLLACEPAGVRVAPFLEEGRGKALAFDESEARKSGILLTHGHELLEIVVRGGA